MPTMLINGTQPEEIRVALVDDNRRLYDYVTERAGFEEKIGNIYLAEITSIEPSLDAVFVNYGSKRHGFLPLKEIAREYFSTQDPEKLERPNIKELLKEGQKVLIQVEKEERSNKGAAVTTYVSLGSLYLVLKPNDPRAGGISRRIEGEDRDELREILSQIDLPIGMGLIIRTAGLGRSLEELQWDTNVLVNYWTAITKAIENCASPMLIHQESDVVIRAIRDYLRQDIKEIIIDNPSIFERAQHYVEQARPDYVSRLKLYSEKIPLFIQYEIEHQIELAHRRTVRLKSGGALVIDHTEALVSIDINSARATKGSDIEETAFNTNIEAAEEIARQLRLRDIGGLIVIDFIDMTEGHRRQVEHYLRNQLKRDRARVQTGRISRFCLLEMSRQRLRPSLQETIQEICPRCNGQGSVRSVESLASSIIRMIEEDAIKENTAQIQLQLSTEAATYLLNEKRGIITDIEQRQHVSILIIPNPNIQYPNYHIKRLRKNDLIEHTNRLQSSYKLIESAEIEVTPKKPTTSKAQDQPLVRNVLPAYPAAPSIPKKPALGLIKRLWASMFGTVTAKEKDKMAYSPKEERQTGKRPHHRSRPHHKQRRPRSTPPQKTGRTPRHAEDRRRAMPERHLPTPPQKLPEQANDSPLRDPTEPSPHRPRRTSRNHAGEFRSREEHPQNERPPRSDLRHDRPALESAPSGTAKPAPIELQPQSAVAPKSLPREEQAPIVIRPEAKKDASLKDNTSKDEK